MIDADQQIDWSKMTFEGSRGEQLRGWRAISAQPRSEALDHRSILLASR